MVIRANIASIDGTDLVQKQYWNIGVAINTPDGLVAPVIAKADQKGLRVIALELAELSKVARSSALKITQTRGATFTISSLGGIAGTNFTPIINAPEVAILGMAKSEIQAAWNGETFEPRLIQPLALSFDHRAVDGVAAALFLNHVGKVLNDFRILSE